MHASRKTAQDEHTNLERNVDQSRYDQATGGGMRLNLEKEMELLFAEADALRQERTEKLKQREGVQHRLQCVTPCRKRVAEVAPPMAAESSSSQYELGPSLETALHQKVIHHHECAQAEIKVVTEDRQSTRLQAENLQADMERNEKFVFGAWEAPRAAEEQRHFEAPHRHAEKAPSAVLKSQNDSATHTSATEPSRA